MVFPREVGNCIRVGYMVFCSIVFRFCQGQVTLRQATLQSSNAHHIHEFQFPAVGADAGHQPVWAAAGGETP